MDICGFRKTTLLDYPEHVAATIFTGGCNFCCPFCHNAGLVLDVKEQPRIAVQEILHYLQKRRGILQGICVTGGEPTLQSDLAQLLVQIKEMGYLVKLDTNGYRPQVLYRLLEKDLLDYVAMDIKASKSNYARVTGVSDLVLSNIEESVTLLKEGSIPYEFRTTVVKGLHRIEEFESVGEWLSGARVYYIQAYEQNENVIGMQQKGKDAGEIVTFSAFSKAEMQEIVRKAKKYIDKVMLRGVE